MSMTCLHSCSPIYSNLILFNDSKHVLLHNNDQNEDVLPDETENENSVLLDKTYPADTPDLPLLETTNSSSDVYPDTTTSGLTLPEAMDTTSDVLSNVSVKDTVSNLHDSQNTSEQTITFTENENPNEELPGTTVDVQPDKMLTVSPKSKLPEATIRDSLTNTQSTDTDLPVNPGEPNASTTEGKLIQPTPDLADSSETVNDIKNESDSNLNESDGTKEKIVGEITFTDLENANSDSKGNLTIEDMLIGVSGMHPLETSSVISEPIDMGVPEATTTTSLSSNNSNPSLPHHTTDKSKTKCKKG